MNRIVARYRDGRLVKGTTLNFSPDAWFCHIQPPDQPYGEGARIEFKDLKALFFVRDLAGNPYHKDSKSFHSKARFAKRVRVRFLDGEEIMGLANLHQHEPGFFVYPADPNSNNDRIFAIRGSVDSVTVLPEGPEADGEGGGGGGSDGGDGHDDDGPRGGAGDVPVDTTHPFPAVREAHDPAAPETGEAPAPAPAPAAPAAPAIPPVPAVPVAPEPVHAETTTERRG